jgi:hypothetical protein
MCSLAASVFVLAGCSAQASQSKTIGEAVDGAQAVTISNDTGKDIEAFYFKKGSDKKYGAALAQDGLLPADASATINVPNEDGAALDMRFVTNDGAKYQLKALKLADMKDISLKLSEPGTSCYVEYTNPESGKTASILESEQIAQDAADAEAAAKADAEKKKKEAEAAKKEAKEAKEQAKKDVEDAELAARKAEAERDAAVAAAEAAERTGKSTPSYSSSSSSNSSSNSSKKSSSSSSSSSKKSSSSNSSKKSSSGSSSSSKKNSSSSSSSSSKKPSTSTDSGQEDNRCIEL